MRYLRYICRYICKYICGYLQTYLQIVRTAEAHKPAMVYPVVNVPEHNSTGT